MSVYVLSWGYFDESSEAYFDGPEGADFKDVCEKLLPEAARKALEAAGESKVRWRDVYEALKWLLPSRGFREIEFPTYCLLVRQSSVYASEEKRLGPVAKEIEDHNRESERRNLLYLAEHEDNPEHRDLFLRRAKKLEEGGLPT